MKKKTKAIKVVYKQVENVSDEEAQRNLIGVFNILFEAMLTF